MGAVAAKEEVWEVSAELLGTVASLALLNGLASLPDDGSADKAALTVGTWAVLQAVVRVGAWGKLPKRVI